MWLMSQAEKQQVDLSNASHITHVAVEHVVVSSNCSYEHIIRSLEKRLGLPANWEVLPRQLSAMKASWEQVAQTTQALIGTSGFTTFVKMEQGILLSLTGKRKRITQYAIGNHLIGVHMIEQVPEVGLYAPPRLLVYEDYEGRAYVAYDRITWLVAQYHN